MKPNVEHLSHNQLQRYNLSDNLIKHLLLFMKKITLAALMLMTAMSMSAQTGGDTTLQILMLDGTSHVINTGDIDGIDLANGKMTVTEAGTEKALYTLQFADIDYLSFSSSTGIHQAQTDRLAPVIRSDDYTFTAENLAEGDYLDVYTLGGERVAHAQASNGKAYVDASQWQNGTYIIKAGKKTIKMLKR